MRTTSLIAAHYRHMYDFQLQALAGIAGAMEQAANMQDGSPPPELEAFYRRYREEWETASAITPDAIRFREDLLRAGPSRLMPTETDAIADLGRALQSGDTGAIKADLGILYNVNVQFADFEYRDVIAQTARYRRWLFIVGISGIALILFLGLHVRRAIAPRIKHMVGLVRRFQDSAKYERIRDTGKDDIAVLANALDTGFSAIASREREREQFLAIAAHELKTPVTSIRGFASVLLNHPDAQETSRATETIYRQSWRLSRLVEALFLAVRARDSNLPFEPKPFDMSALIHRVLLEMEPFVAKRMLSAHVQENISFLGDEALLEHALWSLFTCAAALSPKSDSVDIFFDAIGNQARLAVDIKDCDVPLPELRELFLPFRFVQYETGKQVRSAIGLYLCREIVRLHNGQMMLQQGVSGEPEFLVELPI
jgi:signal transduction histidine kinase